jgi:N-acetylneuraminic acid mutarotase
MYIFGGYVQKIKRFSNDIYEFNFLTSTWTLIQPKSELRPYWRDFHTASSVGDNVFIFGGRMDMGGARFTGESFYSNDLYSFNVIEKKWSIIKQDTSNELNNKQETETDPQSLARKYGPCGRRSHSSIEYKNKFVIFGGYQENINKHFNDLYEFDTDKLEWSLINASGLAPSPRRRHSCCVILDQMFLFGGNLK